MKGHRVEDAGTCFSPWNLVAELGGFGVVRSFDQMLRSGKVRRSTVRMRTFHRRQAALGRMRSGGQPLSGRRGDIVRSEWLRERRFQSGQVQSGRGVAGNGL